MENRNNDFLNGAILSPLLRFAGPVLLALFLQAMYGAVDLIVVGKFAGTADISAVSTGSQAMQLVTSLLVGLTTGVTVLLGQKIGEGKPDEAGSVVGSAICLFVCVALALTAGILRLGIPIALQDVLVGVSFLVILAIVNSLGLLQSAGMGIAEKVCAFVMLLPSAFSQSVSAFVAQNTGAGKPERAKKALRYSVAVSLSISVFVFYFNFFHGDLLAGIFANDRAVVLEAADYLKAYAIDCLLTSFLFCFVGYFSGLGKTVFVMAQGILGAFGVRIPVSFAMSRLPNVRLFYIGLATPCSTVVQVLLCLGYYAHLARRERTAR